MELNEALSMMRANFCNKKRIMAAVKLSVPVRVQARPLPLLYDRKTAFCGYAVREAWFTGTPHRRSELDTTGTGTQHPITQQWPGQEVKEFLSHARPCHEARKAPNGLSLTRTKTWKKVDSSKSPNYRHYSATRCCTSSCCRDDKTTPSRGTHSTLGAGMRRVLEKKTLQLQGNQTTSNWQWKDRKVNKNICVLVYLRPQQAHTHMYVQAETSNGRGYGGDH